MNRPLLKGGDVTLERIPLPATDFTPALRRTLRPSAPPALADAERAFSNEVKSVVSFPTPDSSKAVGRPSEREGFFQENWLFVFPLAMFVILLSFASILALA